MLQISSNLTLVNLFSIKRTQFGIDSFAPQILVPRIDKSKNRKLISKRNATAFANLFGKRLLLDWLGQK